MPQRSLQPAEQRCLLRSLFMSSAALDATFGGQQSQRPTHKREGRGVRANSSWLAAPGRDQKPTRLPGSGMSASGASSVFAYSWLLRAGLILARRGSGSRSDFHAAPCAAQRTAQHSAVRAGTRRRSGRQARRAPRLMQLRACGR